ncbi:CBS domain-containing protein [Yinghuangia sp. YIM S09857]|uniref:CBS domain-containing protein n=1 Tax=Yinghuangia sp. YIM S09857 TaxID=3436929 RepID=UPI003F53BC5A
MDPTADTRPEVSGSLTDEVGATPVREVMSVALVTVAEDESVLMAWEILQRTGFHHLPVVNEDGRCPGLVERSELAVACSSPAAVLSERYVGDLVVGRGRALVHDDAPVSRAATVMTEVGTDALPVLDASGRFVGLLTARDLVALLAGRHKRPGTAAGTGPVLFSLEPVLPYPFED